MSCLRFSSLARRGAARLGLLQVRGRSVSTPAFMPVGTQGSVKGVHAGELVALGYRALLANTYHLHLRPGEATVRALGGLHAFMGFPGVILTDSGGFQVFSLAERRRIDDDGVTFQSHVDGQTLRLTPESSLEVQHELDSDIAMVLDECPPGDAPREVVRGAVDRSLRWARRSLQRHRSLSRDRAVFAILQGGRHLELRSPMAAALRELDFDGYALGGVSVGESASVIRAEVQAFAGLLPEDAPRYLMGVGSPREIVTAVQHGIDLFDCVLPTRNARNGFLYTRQGVLKIRNAVHAAAAEPVEAGCPCALCRGHSRGYLRHLFQAQEMLGPRLATLHNLTFFARLLGDLRAWIRGDTIDLDWLAAYDPE